VLTRKAIIKAKQAWGRTSYDPNQLFVDRVRTNVRKKEKGGRGKNRDRRKEGKYGLVFSR